MLFRSHAVHDGLPEPEAHEMHPRTPSPVHHGPAHKNVLGSVGSSPTSMTPSLEGSGESPSPEAPALPPRRLIKPVRLFDGVIRYDSKKRAFSAEPTSHVDALKFMPGSRLWMLSLVHSK